MAVTTLDGHVSRALDFYNKSEIYFGIGRTTPWEDESKPPDPKNTDKMVEPIGYKKVESKFLVKPDPTGELTYRSTKWKIITPDQAIAQGARWVYTSTVLSYEELPTNVSYRQVATYTGLVRKTGVDANKYNLAASEVHDPGIIEVLDNRTPIYRDADQRETLVIIVEF